MSFAGQVAAANLDAADGVIDGRHFGSQVVAGNGFATTAGYSAPAFASRSVLPAYGSAFPATSYAAASAYPATTYGQTLPTTYGSHFGHTLPATTYGSHFGHTLPATTYGSHFPASTYAPTVAPTTFAAPAAYARPAFAAPVASYGAPAFSGYGASVLPSTYGSTLNSYSAGQAAALSLDAADGVIDGRHFGSQVVARH
eukprot:NODE_2243_length_811_cov_284.883202_g1544_i1.p1 GENE.NODE_2243_length_811_cov_284.883202_g1544_i1~~NODE_2243_length_811_cov_284.883202_g1544_i1.p1  ORF type:complete len:199 (-),score=87.76 NODE_2243_length_811_cov_284.883202_g1544_i1:147-743(-)